MTTMVIITTRKGAIQANGISRVWIREDGMRRWRPFRSAVRGHEIGQHVARGAARDSVGHHCGLQCVAVRPRESPRRIHALESLSYRRGNIEKADAPVKEGGDGL